MTIIHCVQFGFKPEVDDAQRKSILGDMLALKDKCLDPETGKPYIVSVMGGKDSSPEGMQHGVQYAFVMELPSPAVREYYLKMDPVHLAFIEKITPLLAIAQIADFTPGVFE